MSFEGIAAAGHAPRMLLEAVGLSKRYEIYREPADRLKQSLWRGKRQFYDEFWALRDVSLQLVAGETLGLIGQNGAGKSTLLQLLAGTLNPTAGTIERHGRIAAILELGAGFSPDFTGRENARLNAALLGIPAPRIGTLLPEIEAFADIGDFFDRPVKLYSSGMYSRLAFAVATAVDPDILIIDEALSVGDARFQAKCFRRLEQFQSNGKAILFVTHSVDLVLRHCNRALLIDHGRAITEGVPKDVVHTYLDLLFGSRSAVKGAAGTAMPVIAIGERVAPRGVDDLVAAFARVTDRDDRLHSHPAYNRYEYRWGKGGARILDACIVPANHPQDSTILDADAELTVAMRVVFERDVGDVIFGLTLKTPDGVAVAGTNSRDWSRPGTAVAGRTGEIICATFRFKPSLGSGDYLMSLGVAEDADGDIQPLDRRYDCLSVTVVGPGRTTGLADLGIRFAVAAAVPQAASAQA
jgi:homopolymeric O-antigen transport system ATP-binding protein